MTEEHRKEGYVVPGSPAKLDVGHGDQQAQPDASEPSPMVVEAKGGDAEEEGEAKPTTAPTSPQVEQAEKAEQHVDNTVPKGDDDTPIPPALLPSPADLPHPAEALHRPDSPTTQLISSLRTQLTELADQTQALNAKLVASISRHAELEDQHVQLQDSHKDLQGKAQELEVEKKRWEESMNTGLLVERSQIAGEMQRLASGLVEEERRRGNAEERRAKVENEVDDLAASLFDQANTMVAAERMSRVQAESRLKETEENLAAAEAAVRDMQVHFQSLSTSSPPQSSSAPAVTSVAESKLLISHVPYTEFISFISHLRQLRPLKKTSKQLFPPPLVANLLTQAFLARVITEDQDPTVRLDAARDLSYFSRRTVGAAIISGELIVEPVSASTVIASTTTPPPEIGCSLCGKLVFPPNATHAAPNSPSGSHFGPPPNHPGLPAHRSSSRFSLKPFFNTTAATSPNANASPNQSPLASPSLAGSFSQLPSVYVFRVSKPAPTANTGASSQATANANDKVYPLCKSGWCLERLRATCELWHFVRTGIIHVVWHGDDGYALSSEKPGEEINDKRSSIASTATQGETAEKPPLPERKRSAGGWGLGFKLGSSERTPSTGGGSTGGGGWFGRADSATPPPSSPSSAKAILADPADEPESKGRRALGLDEESDLASNTGEKDKRDERETTPEQPEEGSRTSRDVPSIVEVEASPAGPPLGHDTGDGDDGKNLRPSMLGRADSSASLTPSAEGTEEGSFMTPKEQHHELDPEPELAKEDEPTDNSAKEGDKPIDVPDDQVVPESDVQGGDTPQVTDSPQPPASPSAPPIPRRAAARGRAVEKVDLGEQKPEEEKAEENTTEHATQPDLTEEKAAAVTEEANPTESAEIPAEAPVVDLNEDDKAEPATSAAKPPPPLPPRHPRTPTAQVPETTNPSIEVDGEKRWLKADAEGWEEKTWKTVVRLKEEMWRARVGVSGGA